MYGTSYNRRGQKGGVCGLSQLGPNLGAVTKWSELYPNQMTRRWGAEKQKGQILKVHLRNVLCTTTSIMISTHHVLV